MDDQIMPVCWYQELSDAEEFQAELRDADIASEIRKSDDSPPGWGTSPVAGGFNLWVAWSDSERAEALIWEEASQNRLLCERCHENDANFHITAFQTGQETPVVRNLCGRCHEAEFGARP